MWYPDLTVAAICERDGKFLLVEERSKSTQKIVFNQPAGHLEDHEPIIQGVIRETLEETCCHFTPTALVGLYRLRTEHGKTYIRYTFCGDISDVDLRRQLDPDILRTHWMSLSEIESCDNLRSKLVLGSIHDFLAGARYPLEMLREI